MPHAQLIHYAWDVHPPPSHTHTHISHRRTRGGTRRSEESDRRADICKAPGPLMLARDTHFLPWNIEENGHAMYVQTDAYIRTQSERQRHSNACTRERPLTAESRGRAIRNVSRRQVAPIYAYMHTRKLRKARCAPNIVRPRAVKEGRQKRGKKKNDHAEEEGKKKWRCARSYCRIVGVRRRHKGVRSIIAGFVPHNVCGMSLPRANTYSGGEEGWTFCRHVFVRPQKRCCYTCGALQRWFHTAHQREERGRRKHVDEGVNT